MSTCGYHSPHFSEDIAWLPQWLQPHRPPTVGEYRNDSAGVSSPHCENCVFTGGPSQEYQNFQNAMVNPDCYSGFILHLSEDEETSPDTPTNRNILPFSLHLASESSAETSPVEGNDNPLMLNSHLCNGTLEGFCPDVEEQEVNAVSQNQFEAKDTQTDKLPGFSKLASKQIDKPLDRNRHKRDNVSGGKVVRKLRNADVNDAIELSIAASEAMVIADMLLEDSQSNKLATAALEAALHVKEVRKQFFVEETEIACGSSEDDLDETDWLAELDEAEMVDAFQDIGLSLFHIPCSSQDQSTGDLKQENPQSSCPPCNADLPILAGCSSEKQNKRWNSQNADSNDHVSDSFAYDRSSGVIPKELTPCYGSVKQAALGKTISCSRNKKNSLQVSTPHDAALHRSLGALVISQNIHKDGGVSAQINICTKKHVKGLFEKETSFISESVSVDECNSTSLAAPMEIIASSRASFHCNTEGFCKENQDTEAEALCCQVACSSLSLVDPQCSIVPCSISCDECPNIQTPVCKQNEGNEYPTSQALECKQSKEEKEFLYPHEYPRMQDPDGAAGPSCAPSVKSPESEVPFRRREYKSLRPFSTIAPRSNILGGTSTYNADVAVCRLKRTTPITLNKKIQRVQASKQILENNVEAGSSEDFSMFQKKRYYSQDPHEHQISEPQIPHEICQPTVNSNFGKQNLKRRRVQFSEAKLSSRTKGNRKMLTKSRFSRSDSSTEEPPGTSKESIFQGMEFLLTGFHNQKEKEMESLIRKFGGYVLSKVPRFSLDKRKNMAEFPRWKPPIVLSPKKVSTAKFLYGCAINTWILNPDWLFGSLQSGVLLPPGKYLIRPRNALEHSSAFGFSYHQKCNTLIFDGVGLLIHGKISFCSKFSNIIKHGGGQVFISLQGLVQSLKDGSTSHGIILVANEASASRHLRYCGLEHDIKTVPASWIIGSLFSGKPIPLKKDRCGPFRRIRMPSFQKQHVFDMSQEI
ncbi:hypothetical protein ACP4OV_008416 [Aristida adscensionis]